jgi:hypothetical protein
LGRWGPLDPGWSAAFSPEDYAGFVDAGSSRIWSDGSGSARQERANPSDRRLITCFDAFRWRRDTIRCHQVEAVEAPLRSALAPPQNPPGADAGRKDHEDHKSDRHVIQFEYHRIGPPSGGTRRRRAPSAPTAEVSPWQVRRVKPRTPSFLLRRVQGPTSTWSPDAGHRWDRSQLKRKYGPHPMIDKLPVTTPVDVPNGFMASSP